ncbi:MAG: virulence RhuM family protein [Bacilli bacterium]|nr:virulence RhuM family protein [Bacilli bacterium]
MSDKGIIVIYNTESNGTKVEVKLIDGNLWLTQEQIVSLYNSSKSNISEHIKHILEEGELTLEATVRKFRTVQKEGEREVGRNIAYYNLDMILAIGYRVRSNIGTSFRKWATSTLKEYSKRKGRNRE